jgi:hypothetical protein
MGLPMGLASAGAWRHNGGVLWANHGMSEECSTVSDEAKQLIVCGWDEVFIWALNNGPAPCPRKLWTWRAHQRPDLPSDLWERFKTTDECKPVDQGRQILITSSGGAVALVDRASDRVLFYAHGGNAHSAEVLPRDRLVVACSHAADGSGDRLLLFNLAVSDQPCGSAALPWAHGVVWDSARQKLYALGMDDLRIYTLADWLSATPQLRQVAALQWPVKGAHPDECGHDLYPVPGTSLLSVTTNEATWCFDRDTEEFHRHPLLGDRGHVKSLCHHPSGAVAYVQSEGQHWWAERILLCNPDGVLFVPGEHFYKARWNVAVEP